MRKALSLFPLVLVVSLVVVPVVMADPGSGRASRIGSPDRREITVDLSSRGGINQYLASLGIDPGEAIIQRGTHNYAGPKCPGGGWTCTDGIGVVVQLSSGHHRGDDDDDDDDDGHNVFVCSPKGDATTANPDADPGPNTFATCVIVQENDTGRNRATCREHNEQDEGVVTQACSISQVNVSGRNQATVDQSVVMEHDDTTQRSVQRSQIGQLNSTGDNRADVSQRSTLATESEEDEDADVFQEQDAIQESIVNQTTGCTDPTVPLCPEPPLLLGVDDAGDNRAEVFQSHRLEAEVEEAASADQLQNADPPAFASSECNESPNICSVADQTSTDGQLRIDVRQVQRHVAEAEDVELVTQQQGSSPLTGGLETVNHQDSNGVARRTKIQDERQFADVEDAIGPSCPPAANMPCQSQFTGIGPKANSNQQFHEDNFALAVQNVIQLASDPFEQQATLEAFAGFASGQVTFRQFARQNDATESQTVTGTGFVFAEIRCNQGGVEPPPTPEDPCIASQGGE